MEPSHEVLTVLEQMQSPVFLVKDGVITHLNHAAQMRHLSVGISIASLITVGDAEYRNFSAGRLLLNMTIDQLVFNASVVKTGEYDLFYLESEYQSPELKALALAAQNLRDPLSGAMLSIDGLMQKAADQQSSEISEEICKLSQQLYRLQRLVGNMSDAAKYDNKRSLRMENRDAVSFVKEIVEKAAELTKTCGCQFDLKLPSNPVFCMIDADKLERALLNLISNAIKHAPAGGRIQVALQLGLNKLYLSVQNTQTGADSKLQKDLFFRFLREPSLENDNSGIGLGLTIVRGAAIAHDGTVLIEQPDGEGLRFTISLSLSPAGSTQLRSPAFVPVDYCGGYDRALIELSEILPPEAFK